MTTLLSWWSFSWDLYQQALAFGTGLGGLWMLLVYLFATVAFGIALIAPIVLLVKLLILVAVLAFKLAVPALVIWIAVQIFLPSEPGLAEDGIRSALPSQHDSLAPAGQAAPAHPP